MYNLAYNLLIDKVIKRKIRIFSILARSSSPLSIDLLINNSGSSRRTITNYITSFNTEKPYGMEIMISSTNEVALANTAPSAISAYINHITQENVLFYIIEHLYSGTTETIESLSDKLYTSESSIKRYLQHLKTELKKYDLNIQTSPYIDIIGNQSTVRLFFFRYFRYVHDSYFLRIKPNQSLTISTILSSIIAESGYALDIDYPKAIYWFAIFQHQIKNGYTLTLPESVLNLHRNSSSFLRFKKVFIPNFKSFISEEELSESELIFAFLVRLDALRYESNSVYFMEDYLSELNQFESLVSEFLMKNKLHPGLYHELKLSLQAYLLNTTFLSDLSPCFQKIDSELHTQVKNNYPDILNDWLSILVDYKQNFDFLHDVAISLSLITISYMQQTKAPKKILFSFSGEASTINYYKSIALKVIPRDAEVHFIFNKLITDTLLKNLSIDVCIVNFIVSSPITVCPLIQLSTVPIETEWAILLSYLYEI